MTDAEYAMLLAFESGKGTYVPDMSVQHHRDVLRVLQHKKFVTWNPIGDGYILLSKGRAALAEERLRRNEVEALRISASCTPDVGMSKPDSNSGRRITENIISSAISAAVDSIIKKL